MLLKKLAKDRYQSVDIHLRHVVLSLFFYLNLVSSNCKSYHPRRTMAVKGDRQATINLV